MQTELEVMSKIAEMLEPLDASARERVLRWVVGALGIPDLTRTGRGSAADKSTAAASSVSDGSFSTFAELFHAATPRSEKEKALVAAYWILQSSGVDQFVSQQLNTELKHIGYGVTNITDALNQLIADRPNLVIQLTKSGSSKQARKTYKITDAGLRRVSEMLTENGDSK